MKKYLPLLIGALISVLFLVALLQQTSFSAIQTELQTAHYIWLLPTALVLSISLWVRGMRWRVMLFNEPTPSEMFWITNIGYLASNILPLRLGELIRVYLASRSEKITFAHALTTGILERFIDILVICMLFGLTLPFTRIPDNLIQSGLAFSGVALAGCLTIFIAAWQSERVLALTSKLAAVQPIFGRMLHLQLESVLTGIRSLGAARWLQTFGWTVLIWLFSGLSAYLLMFGFFAQPTWQASWITSASTALGLGVPSLPSGVGVYEGIMQLTLQFFGYPPQRSLAYALVLHLTNFVVIGVLGLLGLLFLEQNLFSIVKDARNLQQSLHYKQKEVA